MPITISWKYRYDTWTISTWYEYLQSYNLESIWYNDGYESQTWIYLMETNCQHKTTKKWEKIIQDFWCLATWRWWDWDWQYLIAILTNENQDEIIEYIIKTYEELWDDYYTYLDAFYWNSITDEIWNTVMWRFTLTLTTSSSQWIITISDWSQSITIDSSTHNMRYNADYYTETNNTSSEYSTISTNWWLTDWTYTYSQPDQWYTDRNNIISSLESKWVVNATITHDTTNWEITMVNWQWSFTIMDKNLWATIVYSDWDTLSEANCGKYYQRWNNYWFPRTWNVTTSSTQVDTTWYWPWNYYSSSTFIQWYGWINPTNDNLRWDSTDTEAARQWPCPNWYHIPSETEWKNFIKMFKIIRPNAHSNTDFKNTFAIPQAGNRNPLRSVTQYQGSYATYWSSSPSSEWWVTIMRFDNHSSQRVADDYSSYGYSIRPFKNTTPSS